MAVLCEAISVIVKIDRFQEAFENRPETFNTISSAKSVCLDNDLLRIGFMAPEDVKAFVKQLRDYGLVDVVDGSAVDFVVVDQQKGPTIKCNWLDFGHVHLDGNPLQRVAACKLTGNENLKIATPVGWKYEGSLSQAYGFVPTGHLDKSLTFLRHDDGTDVYLNRLTGREVFIGRSKLI